MQKMAQLKAILSPVHLRRVSRVVLRDSSGLLWSEAGRETGTGLGHGHRRASSARNGTSITEWEASPSPSSPTSMATTHEYVGGRLVQFSSSRARDLTGHAIELQQQQEPMRASDGPPQEPMAGACLSGAVRTEHQEEVDASGDRHVESYDSRGSISLYAVMQTMVPEPFSTQGKKAPTHFNMPGGHVMQGDKYLSDSLNETHYRYHEQEQQRQDNQDYSTDKNGPHSSVLRTSRPIDRIGTFANWPPGSGQCRRWWCSSAKVPEKLTSRMKLKQAVKDYGATILVFHVTISLLSLGGFYLAVSSGVDVSSFGAKLAEWTGTAGASSDLAKSVGTFALAYAVHKMFAPVRIGITLTSAPFLVRYLRRIGFIKPPKNSP